MISLSQETETLAQRVAVAQRLSVEVVIKQALEERARVSGISLEVRRPQRRMSIAEILAVGTEISEMPVLDPRSAHEIADDLNTI